MLRHTRGHVADIRLTVNQRSTDSWLTVGRQLTKSQPTVGRPNSWSTISRQGTVLHFYRDMRHGHDVVTIFAMWHAYFYEVLSGRQDLSPQHVAWNSGGLYLCKTTLFFIVPLCALLLHLSPWQHRNEPISALCAAACLMSFSNIHHICTQEAT